MISRLLQTLLISILLETRISEGRILCSYNDNENENFWMEKHKCFKYVDEKADYMNAKTYCHSLMGELANLREKDSLPQQLYDLSDKSKTTNKLWTKKFPTDAEICNSSTLATNTLSRLRSSVKNTNCSTKLPFLCTRNGASINESTAEDYWAARRNCEGGRTMLPNTTTKWQKLLQFINIRYPKNRPTEPGYRLWIGLVWTKDNMYWDTKPNTTRTTVKLEDLPFKIELPDPNDIRTHVAAINLTGQLVFVTMKDRLNRAYIICGTLPPTRIDRTEIRNQVTRGKTNIVIAVAIIATVVLIVITVTLLVLKRQRSWGQHTKLPKQRLIISKPFANIQNEDSSTTLSTIARQLSDASYVSMHKPESRKSSVGYVSIPHLLPGAKISMRFENTTATVARPGISREALQALTPYQIPINVQIPGYLTFDPRMEAQPRQTEHQYNNEAFEHDQNIAAEGPLHRSENALPLPAIKVESPENQYTTIATTQGQHSRILPPIPEEMATSGTRPCPDCDVKHVYTSIKLK